MWLYIFSSFSREQSQSSKCKQRGPRVASHFPSVPLLSRGFHKHILLSLCILLSLSVCPIFSTFSLCVSFWKPIVKTWSFPPQCQCKRAPFAVMACLLEMWTLNGPHSKHTVRPESVFEGLPRSWVLTNWLKGIMCGVALRELRRLNVLNVRRRKVAGRSRHRKKERTDELKGIWWIPAWRIYRCLNAIIFYSKHTANWLQI